jgi:hypothetical protein
MSVVETAEEFIDAWKSRPEQKELETARKEVEKWESKIDRFKKSDPLREKIEQDLERAKGKHQDLEKKQEKYEKSQQKMLDRIQNEFYPGDDWTDETVLRALNLVIIGKDREFLRIGNDVISEDTEIKDTEKMVEIAENIREIAKDAKEGSKELKEFWEKFRDPSSKKLQPFKVILESSEPLGGTQISEEIEEDVSSNVVGQRLRDVVNSWDFNPYYREKGKYSLSLIGEYLAQNYLGEDIQDDEQEEFSDEMEDSEDGSREEFWDEISE